MTVSLQLLICHSPRETHWRIGSAPDGFRTSLLGWKTRPASTECGVPETVANLLARALAQTGKTTFATGHGGADAVADNGAPDHVCDLSVTGVAAHLLSHARGLPSRLFLRSSTDPHSLRNAFVDDSFSWVMQAQILLVTATDSPPLSLTRAQWVSLFADHSPVPPQIVAIVRPGVDGDVAAFFFKDIATEQVFFTALLREANRAGGESKVMSESEFAEAISEGE